MDILPQLISCGVDSLKIEGRMKNSYYVAATVSAYRQAVDAIALGAFNDALVNRLKRQMAEMYNRGGFTEGYFNRHNGPEMMSMDRPGHQGIYVGVLAGVQQGSITFITEEALSKGDVISVMLPSGEELSLTVPKDCKKGGQATLRAGKTRQMRRGMPLYRTRNAGLMAYLENEYISGRKKEKVKIQVIIKQDLYATMKISLGDLCVSVQGGMVTRAKHQPLTRAVIWDKVSKLGNTPFMAEDIVIEADEEAFLPVSELNELRRRAVEALTEQLKGKMHRLPVKRISPDCMERKQRFLAVPVLSALVTGCRVLEVVLGQSTVSRVYLDLTAMSDAEAYKAASMVTDAGKELIVCMPHIFRYDGMRRFEEFLCGVKAYDGLLLRNIDSYAYVKNSGKYTGKQIIGDASLYAYNRSALAYYEKGIPGMQFVMPRELSGDMLRELWGEGGERLVFDVYGNLPVMVSAQCMQRNTDGCHHKAGALHMRDRKGVDYTVQSVCRDCYNLIYNGIDYSLLGLCGALCTWKPGEVRLLFRDEDSGLAAALIRHASSEFLFAENTSSEVRATFEQYGVKTTRGHFRRGIE